MIHDSDIRLSADFLLRFKSANVENESYSGICVRLQVCALAEKKKPAIAARSLELQPLIPWTKSSTGVLDPPLPFRCREIPAPAFLCACESCCICLQTAMFASRWLWSTFSLEQFTKRCGRAGSWKCHFQRCFLVRRGHKSA